MRTIMIPRNANEGQRPSEAARRENVILRTPEGEEFILAEIGDFNRELARQNKALMKFLDARARQTETVPLDRAATPLGLNERARQFYDLAVRAHCDHAE